VQKLLQKRQKVWTPKPGSAAYDAKTKAVLRPKPWSSPLTRAHFDPRTAAHLRRQPQHGCGLAKKSEWLTVLWLTVLVGHFNHSTSSLRASDDVLELDELWYVQEAITLYRPSFGAKTSAGFGWLSAAGHAKLLLMWIVAYVIGSRDEEACRLLWERIPLDYKVGLLYTDFWAAYADWAAYAEGLPQKRHRATGKGEGQTCRPNKASYWAI